MGRTIELTKEKVIAVVLADTVELLEPYMRDQQPDITQQRIDQLMNLMTMEPQLMRDAKNVAREYYINKFNVCVLYDTNRQIKKLY